MEHKAINRVAQYMSMLLAHIELTDEINAGPNNTEPPPESDDKRPVFHFMGSGASDMLMLSDIKAFVAEVRDLVQLPYSVQVIQDRAQTQIEKGLGAIASLSKLLDRVVPQQTPPGQVKSVIDFGVAAYAALDDSEELTDGVLISLDHANTLGELVRNLDSIAASLYETDVQGYDGRETIRRIAHTLDPALAEFQWVVYDDTRPNETLPRETGMYVVECHDPGQGPNMHGEPEYPASTYYLVCNSTVIFAEDGTVHDYDHTVYGYAGDFDFDRDVVRYAKIPAMKYIAQIERGDDDASTS